MTRTYKGFEIARQNVGPKGWNVSLDGKCTSGMTGHKTIRAAKDWVNYQIEAAAA